MMSCEVINIINRMLSNITYASLKTQVIKINNIKSGKQLTN